MFGTNFRLYKGYSIPHCSNAAQYMNYIEQLRSSHRLARSLRSAHERQYHLPDEPRQGRFRHYCQHPAERQRRWRRRDARERRSATGQTTAKISFRTRCEKTCAEFLIGRCYADVFLRSRARLQGIPIAHEYLSSAGD